MNNTNSLFLRSALERSNTYAPLYDIVKWVKEQNEKVSVEINQVPFSQLKGWSFSQENGTLKHKSGQFFSIDGLRISTNWGAVNQWHQPIINQPEIGYLGFITQEINGVLHFLVQAKIEPGNVNYVQLSPTLQATRSNYLQIHEGKKPLYLEFFQNASKKQILLDQLQSEQGARFLRKRNRNIIIKIDEEIPLYDNFTWVTLGQLKELMLHNNLVNMDSRTVISGISFGSFDENVLSLIQNFLTQDNIKRAFLKSALTKKSELHTTEEIITFLTRLKSNYDLKVDRIRLDEMSDWEVTDMEISHVDKKYFKIIGVDVKIGNREVKSWCQPMVQPMQDGLCAFICKEFNGVMHFLVQAKLECGNHDIIEFAPTVQTLTGGYKSTPKNSLPYLDYVLDAKSDMIVYDTIQSEEGGRFYKEQNRNMILMGDDSFTEDIPENFIWMTLNQLNLFLQFNNYLNIQARSLIAAITFIN
jgi:oxidase EvaA